MIIAAMLLAAQDPAPPMPKTVDDSQKITCKEQLKTGSRVNFIRICHTAAEWTLLRQENRKVVERGQREGNWNNPNEGDKPHQ